ncbi:MAG: oligosaccharide flippase family protein [Bacteroidales bacterium]|nr:oligosaccharide flippase family protein [Bacteroidales bacterium]
MQVCHKLNKETLKQKEFIFNICLLIFLNLLIKPFWILGIDVGVQNQVGAEQYGLYFAIFNFTFLFNMILDMGITNFNNRNIARHSQLLSKHFSGIVTLKLLLGVAYMIVTMGVALIIGYRGIYLKLLLWTAFNQFLNTFILYLRSNISALMLFKTDSCLSVLDRLLMILICGVLLWGNVTSQPFQIEWFVYSQTAAYSITAVIALIIVLKKAKFQKIYWNTAFFAMILKKSLPFALLYLLMSFYNRIDSVMIERILPVEISTFEAGIYASAFRLLDALVMIAYLFSVILLPLFSKMLKEREDLTPIVKTSFSLLFFFAITSAILLCAFRFPILNLLYNEHIKESADVFRLIIFCIIPFSMSYLFGTLLTAHGDMKALNIVAFAGILVNLLVNIILIPRLHAVGAAIASLSTQSVTCLLQIGIALKKINFPLKKLPLVSALSYTLLLILSIEIVNYFIPNYNPLISLVGLSLFACVLAFSTRLISLGHFSVLKIKQHN